MNSKTGMADFLILVAFSLVLTFSLYLWSVQDRLYLEHWLRAWLWTIICNQQRRIYCNRYISQNLSSNYPAYDDNFKGTI